MVFRTDASLDIGTGHVMRCLTLAGELREQGAQCLFVSREHPGNLLDLVRERGFEAVGLAMPDGRETEAQPDPTAPKHAHWLGASWQDDARQTLDALSGRHVDWLVVDHYALDQRWEAELRQAADRLMVIDDLADRPHDCHLLLDQNLGRRIEHYSALVPSECKVHAGADFALLRPEFAAAQKTSLERRRNAALQSVLLTFGGIDKANVTGAALQALSACELPGSITIDVVSGAHSPHIQDLRELAATMPWPTRVLVGVENMAQLMSNCDMAIGAAGGTALERCCLGVPSVNIVTAANQASGAIAFARAGAALIIESTEEMTAKLPPAIKTLTDSKVSEKMSLRCSELTDGHGCQKIVKVMSNPDTGD